MRHVLPALALSCLLAAPAVAQRSGTYAVEGIGLDGVRYEGTAQFQATGPKTWRITWRLSGETFTGIGVAESTLLAVGYTANRETGAILYVAMPNGTLEGLYTQGREGGVGSEKLTPR